MWLFLFYTSLNVFLKKKEKQNYKRETLQQFGYFSLFNWKFLGHVLK